MTERCTQCGAWTDDGFSSSEIAPAVLCEACCDRSFGSLVVTVFFVMAAGSLLLLVVAKIGSVILR